MAVNALGLPLLLQTTSVQLQDLLNNLQAGDQLKGRVVELLPDNKAIVNLKGQNVVAQLPANSGAQKGDILNLLVTQTAPAEAGQAAALTLRLLPSLGTTPQQSLPSPSTVPLPPQAQLEQALAAAKLPVNNVTLTAAQTLARLGAPLDAGRLQAVVQAVESLLTNEQASAPQAPAPAIASPEVQQAIQESLAQVKVAAQLSSSSQASIVLTQAAQGLERALAAAQSTVVSTPAGPDTGPAPQPQVQLQAQPQAAPSPIQTPSLPPAAQTAPQARQLGVPAPLTPDALGAPAAAPIAPQGTGVALPVTGPSIPAQAEALAQAVSASVQTVLDQPTPAHLDALVLLLQQAAKAAPTIASPIYIKPQLQPAQALQSPVASPASTASASTTLSAETAGTAPQASGLPQNAPDLPAPGPGPALSPQTPAATSQAAQSSVSSQATTAPAAAGTPAPTNAPAAAPAQSLQRSAGAQPSPPTTPGIQINANGQLPAPPPAVHSPVPPPAQSVGAQVILPAASGQVPAQREALAQWLGSLEQKGGPFTAAGLAADALALAQDLADPAQAPAQDLVAAVQSQMPDAEAASVIASARQALQQAAAVLQKAPAQVFPSVASLRADLQAQGLPAPRLSLSSLPVEIVTEAVAWLQARDLPPQRPLVEAVASWMEQDRSVMPAAQKAAQTTAALPAAVFEAKPSLKQAYESLRLALESSGLRPEDSGLAARLQQWSKDQGLMLESDLAQANADQAMISAGAKAGSQPALRPALLHLEDSLREAMRDPAASQPGAAPKLEAALKDVQTAVRGFNALPLQAQAAPAFDTVHLPLPVWLNGNLGDGRLSVTWRQGRERTLDDKDPVNVAVALKTESLGEVKVMLQVWKDAASARVIAQDPQTAAFLSTGADELRQNFDDRTPFTLQALDFVTAKTDAPSGPDAPETPLGGFSLSA